MPDETNRSHRFRVEVGGCPVPIMKVTGLAPVQPDGSRPVVNLTRAVMPGDDYLRAWADGSGLSFSRGVKVTVLRSGIRYIEGTYDETAGEDEVFMTFSFRATPKSFCYSELDAGSNQLFLETLQLYVNGMKIESLREPEETSGFSVPVSSWATDDRPVRLQRLYLGDWYNLDTFGTFSYEDVAARTADAYCKLYDVDNGDVRIVPEDWTGAGNWEGGHHRLDKPSAE